MKQPEKTAWRYDVTALHIEKLNTGLRRKEKLFMK